MANKFLLVALGLCTSLLFATPSNAHTVLEQVARTGVLTAGTSKDAFPFAYQDESGKLVGYSIDMMELIRLELEKELQRPVKLELLPLNSDERLTRIETAGVDLVCDASSFTWERDKRVDFSVSYGITGTRLLVPVESNLSTPESLIGKRIGALPKTTNELAIRKQQPQAKVILMSDRAEGYEALKKGKIDAFADDGVLLYAALQREPIKNQFKVASHLYSQEGIACMLPENDSRFERVVNLALIRYMQGYLAKKPEYGAIFDRWFGSESDAPLTQDLRELMIETMQLMLDFKEELPEESL